jgi:pre-rRNA-processing protein TSR3
LPDDEAPRIFVLLLRQDDPGKCTAAKLARFRLAKPIYKLRQVPRRALVLNPFAEQLILNRDRQDALNYGLVAIDCSWERVQLAFQSQIPGVGRRLPTLLASNPVNYAKPHKLSSLEALAASLHIMGFRKKAAELLALFKWGPNFLTLNEQPLEAYMNASDESELVEAQSQFF